MKQELHSTIEYQTSDLGLAAALLSRAARLEAINREDPRRAVFVFALKPSDQTVLDDFWNGRLLVDARTYFDSIKTIKSRLYSR